MYHYYSSYKIISFFFRFFHDILPMMMMYVVKMIIQRRRWISFVLLLLRFRLFIDSVLIVFFHDTSCRLDNRYFGHNSHHVRLYIKKGREKNVLLCEDLFHEC